MKFSEKAIALCKKHFGHDCLDCPEELRTLCGRPFVCPPKTFAREEEENAYIEKFNEIAERY